MKPLLRMFTKLSLVIFLFSIAFLPRINSAQNNKDQVLFYSLNASSLHLRLKTPEYSDTVSIQISFPFVNAAKIQVSTSNDEFHEIDGESFEFIDHKEFLEISTKQASIQISKNNCKISTYRDNELILSQSIKVIKYDDFEKIRVTASMEEGEHFYGFGEKFNGLDQRDNQVVMELNDAYMSDDESTYKSIPFFLSSRKYGMLVNSPKRVIFNMGNKSETEYDFENPDSYLEYFLFTNKNPLEILSQYTSLTGRSPIIPKWSLEPWLSRRRMTGWNSPMNAEANIDMMVNNGFRIGVVLWEGIRSMFKEPHFAKMTKLSDKWHQMGIKQICWGYTGHIEKSEVEKSVINKGYFIRFEDSTLCEGGYSGTNYYIDPTNPDAMEWWKKTLYNRRFLGSDGKSSPDAWNLDGVKLDFSELFPKNDFNLLNIDKAIGMHNQHAVLFSEQIYNWLQTIKPDGGITWVRGGGIGLQRVGYSWGGDRRRTFDQLRGTVSASLGISICGVSLIGHDLGGYRGGNSLLESKVYIRGVQYATFSPSFHDHGSAPAPWEQNEYGIDNYSFYSRVRYNILPYLYHYVKVSNETGIPIMRTLYMHHPNDDKTYTIEDQYYLGEEMIVAPILTESNERQVYLPAGNWIDFWEQKQIEGGQYFNWEVPLNRIPLFVKEGSIIPLELNNEMEIGGLFSQDQKNDLLLSFRLFEGNSSQLKFFRKDSINVKKIVNDGSISVNIDNVLEDFGLLVDGITAKEVLINGKRLEKISDKSFSEIKEGWMFDESLNQLLIKIDTEEKIQNYNIEILRTRKEIRNDLQEINLETPKILNIVGWDQSVDIVFSTVKEAESYLVKYWNDNEENLPMQMIIQDSPATISNLENDTQYSFTISSVNDKNYGEESLIFKTKPQKRMPFFVSDGEGFFINSGHFLVRKIEKDSTRKFTYGISLPDSNLYSVWLKFKRDHSHYLYYRWYEIGEVTLDEGENYFSLNLMQEGIIPGMLYFSADKEDRPFLKNEIEADFDENEINILKEKIIKYRD